MEATSLFNYSAPASSIARKAEFNSTKSGALNFADESELVAAVSEGRVNLDAIADHELPEQLQSLGKAEQQAMIEERAQRRDALQQEIAVLSKQRSAYVADELSKTEADESSIDNKIYQAVRKQAGKKGLVYLSDTPKY